MEIYPETMKFIQKVAGKKLLFLPHALRQMSRTDRMITSNDVRLVIENGEIIEGYPEDVRGNSFLILGYGNKNRAIHIICSPKTDYLAIITAYLPNQALWEDNYKIRRKS